MKIPGERGEERSVFRVEREPRALLERVSWRRVLVTGLGAFALVVAAVSLADLGRGTSVVSDRGTTFFDRGRAAPAEEAPRGRRDGPTAPAETTPAETPAGEEVEPATTEPPATTPTATMGTTTTP